MTEPVASGPSEAAMEVAKQAATQNARGRGWRGNDLEAWAIRGDAFAAVVAAFAGDEPRIRADERQRVVQEIVEALREESNAVHGRGVQRLREIIESREKWAWFNRAADFIERRFASEDTAKDT